MKHAVALLVAIVLPVCAYTAESDPDAEFFKAAAYVGMAAIEAGKLAQARAFQASVRDFGAMMVKDHGMANSRLRAIAGLKGVALPEESNPEHKAQHQLLESKQGAAFDAAYIEMQIRDHEDTIAFLESEIATGQGRFAKAFAKAVLPKVKKHLDALKTLHVDSSDSSAMDSSAEAWPCSPAITPNDTCRH